MSPSRSEKTATLLYANSEIDADMLYFSKFLAPDPFLAIGLGRQRIGILSPLEIGRASKDSGFTEILSLTDVRSSAKRALGVENPKISDIIRFIAQSYKIDRFRVPHSFPYAIAKELEKARIAVELGPDPFFPERAKKNDEEAKAIREGNKLSSAGFSLVQKILKEAKINQRNFLIYQGKRLTSEFLQQAIAKRLLELGGFSANTIVAGGDQACDPHERGSGPLKAHELIIVDIFPRVNATHYHGDMTRTFLKGTASPEQKRLVAAVKAAHGKALEMVKARVRGSQIHKGVVDYFESAGFRTEREGDTYRGFFHGTGHGLGLDIHESPRVALGGGPLKTGNVVTIEPGLYYPGLGACRIEDVVRVTKDGYELLSKHSYTWEIK